jgi:hypothetical protein
MRYFACFVGLDVHLLQIQINFLSDNHRLQCIIIFRRTYSSSTSPTAGVMFQKIGALGELPALLASIKAKEVVCSFSKPPKIHNIFKNYFDVKLKICHKKMHRSGSLEERKMVLDAITALSPENVSCLAPSSEAEVL